MSQIIENRDAYLENFKYYNKREPGNFTPFYIVVALCTVVGLFLFILNIVVGCCSRYSRYWNDRHTGNRWIVSIWTSTPHNQPPIDYTELEDIYTPRSYPEQLPPSESTGFVVPQSHPEQPSQHHHSEQGEFVELQKRESEI